MASLVDTLNDPERLAKLSRFLLGFGQAQAQASKQGYGPLASISMGFAGGQGGVDEMNKLALEQNRAELERIQLEDAHKKQGRLSELSNFLAQNLGQAAGAAGQGSPTGLTVGGGELGDTSVSKPQAPSFDRKSLLRFIDVPGVAELYKALAPESPIKGGPGDVFFDPSTLKPMASVPSKPEKPATVNTAEGVYVLNPDGTRGARLGGPTSLVTINQPPTGYEKTTSGMQAIPGGPQDPATIRAQEEIKKDVEVEAKRKEAAPKLQGQIQALESQTKFVEGQIDKALSQISTTSAGLGSVLSVIPTTGARNLSSVLDSIKANIGFDALQEMRANSPTGGALGQVAVMELQMLQATQGSLDQAQSPEQLKTTLEALKKMLPKRVQRLREAFDNDFKGGITPEKTEPVSLDDYLKQQGY